MRELVRGLNLIVLTVCTSVSSSERELEFMTPSASFSTINIEDVLKVARIDAEKAYRDLSIYRVIITIEDNGWHVVYELKNQNSQGGGPSYLISPATGKILSKIYNQ
jgi:hypothetical protein